MTQRDLKIRDCISTDYREILKIDHYNLRKPLECSLRNRILERKGMSEKYIAAHYLPSILNAPDGREIRGVGSTEEEAFENLEKALIIRYEELEEREILDGESKLQLDYFNIIIEQESDRGAMMTQPI